MARIVRRLGGLVVVALLTLLTVLPAAAQDTPTGSIEVKDQAPVNGQIMIDKVSISQDGWIIVHKAGPDGKLLVAPNIGAVQIKAGESTNVMITLTEEVANGASVWPMLHIDGGVIGTYEFPNGPDTPVVANGAPVMQQITLFAGVQTGPAMLPTTGGEASLPLLFAVVGLVAIGAAFALRRRAA